MTSTAENIMTRDVVFVNPDAHVPAIASLLIKHAISAMPVIDAQGQLVGMVSERDLMKPFLAKPQARREWWLELLAEKVRGWLPNFFNLLARNGTLPKTL